MSYLDLDFKERRPAKSRFRRKSLSTPRFRMGHLIRGLTALAALIGASLLGISLFTDSIAKVEDSNPKNERLHYPVNLPDRNATAIAPETPAVASLIEPSPWLDVQVKSGHTLASIFAEADLTASDTYEVVIQVDHFISI